MLFSCCRVFLLASDDAVKSFDEPAPQVDAMKRGSAFSQRAFLLFAENMFVEKPLIGSLWLVVLARKALAVFPFDFIDQHLFRTEEVAEVRPFLAEPNQVRLEIRAVDPPFAEELPADGSVLLLDMRVVVAVSRPRP